MTGRKEKQNKKIFVALMLACSLALISLTGCISNKKPDSSSEATASAAPAEVRKMTDEQALTAITNYLYIKHDLQNYKGEAPCYWNIEKETSTGETAVVYWRSYTAAFSYYYINRVSGETYVMVSEPGSEEAKRTDETFNAWDYLNKTSSANDTGKS